MISWCWLFSLFCAIAVVITKELSIFDGGGVWTTHFRQKVLLVGPKFDPYSYPTKSAGLNRRDKCLGPLSLKIMLIPSCELLGGQVLVISPLVSTLHVTWSSLLVFADLCTCQEPKLSDLSNQTKRNHCNEPIRTRNKSCSPEVPDLLLIG